MITGATRLAGIIGDPVRHSLSPLLHNTAYTALELDWTYLAFEIAAEETLAALDAARTFGLVGVSVTMPHKTSAAVIVDEMSDDARALHSVNTVTVRDDGTLKGDSTDGEGFVRALHEAGCDPKGRRALVLGAGGAARPVVLALGRAGADVTVAARRADAGATAAALADAPAIAWGDRDDAVREADIVVNATPIGMSDGESPIASTTVRADLVVADLVYHPLETPLLAAARAAGARPVDGLGMLVHQAALQVEHWSGRPAPVDAMRAAVRAELERRRDNKDKATPK